MEITPTKLFVAAKAFILHEGKVLIVRESGSYADGANNGLWDLPGGRMNIGERIEDVLHREVLEEAGLRVEIENPLFVGEWRPVVRGEGWQIIGIFYQCKALSSSVSLSSDHDAFEWIDPSKYKEYNLIENFIPVLEAYLAKNNGK